MAKMIETALGRFTRNSEGFARHTALSEPLQLRLMKRAFELMPGVGTFFDIGANLGVYSVYLGSTGACRKIVAVEPDPETYAELSANLALNFGETGFSRTHNVAASDAKGELRFDARATLGPGNRILAKANVVAAGRETTVRADRLDAVIGTEGPRDAVLKMDVEGHEAEALAGADRLIANRVAFAQIECWKGRERRLADLRAFMAERGFAFLCRIKGDQVFLHESRAAIGPALMETYFDHVDAANALLERLALVGAKAEMNREVSELAIEFFNGFERINLAKWRRRIDQVKGRKG